MARSGLGLLRFNMLFEKPAGSSFRRAFVFPAMKAVSAGRSDIGPNNQVVRKSGPYAVALSDVWKLSVMSCPDIGLPIIEQ